MGRALQALARVTHRGAAACDSSGDGAGVLTQIPARLFGRDPEGGEPFALGAFFLPRDPSALALVTSIIEEVLAGEGLPVLAWRDVPRSEEHTSELQSRLHLVCRLLLEKKKHILKT